MSKGNEIEHLVDSDLQSGMEKFDITSDSYQNRSNFLAESDAIILCSLINFGI